MELYNNPKLNNLNQAEVPSNLPDNLRANNRLLSAEESTAAPAFPEFGCVNHVTVSAPELIQVGDIVCDDDDSAFRQFRMNGRNKTMTQNMAVIRGGFCGGRIKARISKNSRDESEIEFVQLFDDGEVSGVISIKQSDLLAVVSHLMEEERLQKASMNSVADLPRYFKRNRDRAFKILDSLRMRYYSKVNREPIRIEFIVSDLFSALSSLPVVGMVHEELDSTSIYRIICSLMELGEWNGYHFLMPFKKYLCEHEDLYLLDTFNIDQIENAFEECGYKITGKEIIKKLYEGGFLHLTENVQGLQIRARYASEGSSVKDRVGWFYGVYNFEFMKRINGGTQDKIVADE